MRMQPLREGARASDADADDVAAAVREAVGPLILAQHAQQDVQRHGGHERLIRHGGAAGERHRLGVGVDSLDRVAGAQMHARRRQQLRHALPNAARAAPAKSGKEAAASDAVS